MVDPSADHFEYNSRFVLYVLGLLDLDTVPASPEWVDVAVDVERAFKALPEDEELAIWDYLHCLPPEISPATMNALDTMVAFLGGPKTRR